MKMIRWICGISMKDRTSEELRKLVAVESITTVIRSGMLRWYCYVMRKSDDNCWLKKCMEYEIESRRTVVRPRRTWLEIVEADIA